MKNSGFSLFLQVWLSVFATLGHMAASAQQTQRPDAGSLQEPQSQIPLLPQPGAPQIVLPQATPTMPVQETVRITPLAFRFEGNTVFDSEHLSALLADEVNRPTNLVGLNDLAALVSRYYRERGYLLTEVYLPEQALQATGGTVTLVVIEARVGKVQVRVEDDNGSVSFARRVVATNLKPGTLITENLLDKPVLLLRDLAGIEASASVAPGERLGEADVTVTIRSQGTLVDGSVGTNNFGSGSVGSTQLYVDLNVSNMLGRGDVFSARVQTSEASRGNLYRLNYALPVAASGMRLALSAVQTSYALGRQFAALGASGKAEILGASLTHPLVRARQKNLYGQWAVEQKKFEDKISTPANDSERQILAMRLGLLGNYMDTVGGADSFSSYALNATFGYVKLDAANQAIDQGTGGQRTAGGFSKLNLEYQRVQYFGSASSLHLNFLAQQASKNLASAEKMALGGPSGVRGYPVGEGVGDAGQLLSLEYRYHLPASMTLVGEPVSLAVFYDHGVVKLNQDDATSAGAANQMVLGAAGIGALAGRVNSFRISTYLAWRTTHASPTTGDPDQSPRAWVSAQKWL